MIKEFKYSFNELEITPEDLTELLGFEDGAIPEPFPELIEKAILSAPQLCDIKCGYRVFNTTIIDLKKESIKIEDQTFFPTKIVTTQLKESESIAIFIATAGANISNYSNQILNEDDPILGYIFDVIGSIAVEKATDKMQKYLEVEVQKSGLNISDRYSPGYCEWSVAEQKNLFQLMPENFCGVSLSESSLMNPIKSVSGIIGIGTNLQQKGYQCHWCTDTNCIYGKIKIKKSKQ